MKNERGQMSVEYLLVLVVFVAVALTVSSGFRNQEIFANLVSGPWRSLAGLIQNGVWGTPNNTMSTHPNLRVFSVRGEVVE